MFEFSREDHTLHLYTVIDKFGGQLQKSDNVIHEDTFVAENLHSSILGRPATGALKLIVWIEQVTATDTQMITKIPSHSQL